MAAFGSAESVNSRPSQTRPLARLRQLLGRLFGGAAVPSEAAASTFADNNDSDPSAYVVAPGGYRIRVPNRERDTDHASSEAIPSVREALASVPPLPHVVIELFKEVQSQTSTSASVAEIAATDPALAAALLRTVNSAAFSLNRNVTNVADAIGYLGFGTVHSIVVKLGLDKVMPRSTPKAAADTQDLWVHCLAVSYVADCLAKRVPGVDAGLAATLGLLHDIGKLAIIARLGDDTTVPPTGDGSPRQLEARAYGTDHAGLGADLAHRWGLPADLVNAIRWHHDPQKAFEPTDPPALRQAAFLVQVANELAKYAYPYSEQMELDASVDAACAELSLPHPISKLMDNEVRAAITRAILSGWDNADANQPPPRRFIRLRRGEEAIALAKDGAGSPSRVQVDEARITVALTEAAMAINLATSSSDHKSPPTGTVKFIAPATPEGIAKLHTAVLAHQQSLPLAASPRGPAAFTLRALLPNLVNSDDPKATIELAQSAKGGKLNFVVRADSLKFEKRLGQPTDAGAKLVEAELSSVLNLDWFKSISIMPDGSGWMFAGR